MTNVIKMSKKAFTWSVVLTTILWSMGIAALIPAGIASSATIVDADTVEAGDLVQRMNDESRAVYYITEDMERMYFPNAAVFNTWYANFDDVKTVDADFDEMWPPATQSVVAPRPGSDLLFKTTASARVYAMGVDNKRYHIADEAAAEALFGSDWASKVVDWPDYVMSGWTIAGEEIDAPYDGYVAMDGDTYYQYMDDMWEEVTGTVPDFVEAMEYSTFSDYEISDDTTTAASLTEDPSQGAQGGTTVTPTDPGSVTIQLAGDTPDSSYVYKNSTHNHFTKINFTAGSDPVTIDSFLVQRTGAPASDSAFSGVNVLKEDGTLMSASYKTLNSDHQVTFTQDLEIPANDTVSIVLLGKMADSSSYGGEVPKLSLVSVETDADVTASLPLEGDSMTVNTTVTVGVATVSESPDLSTLTEEVGTEDVEFLNVKISNDSASNIDLWINSMRFNNAGSADDDDVENLELVVDGNVVAESTMDNNYVYFDLSDVAEAEILNGKNETFQLRGDIVGGSGRNLDFDIKKADDIFAYDQLNGSYVTPSAAIDSGRTITISRGTLNVSKTNTVSASNVAEDTSDIQLGSWNFKVQGEPITINTIAFEIDRNGTVSSSDFTQLKLVDEDGNAYTGTTSGADASTSDKDGTFSYSDSFTLEEGDNEVILTGKISTDAAADDWVQMKVDFDTVSTDNLDATGDVTGDAITIGSYAFPNADVTANKQTIKDVGLAVTTLPSPAAQSIAGGSSDHLYSTVRFDATDSSEDIKVTAFEFYIIASATAKTNEVQNITFIVDGEELTTTKDGSRTDADSANDEEVSVSLSGADQFVIPAGGAVNMEIYADLTAGATAGGTHKIEISSNDIDTTGTQTCAVTAQGSATGNTVTPTYSTAAGSVMTVGAAGGLVEVSLSSDTPNGSLFAANTDVTLAAFKFYSTSTEDVELDYLYLTQVVTDTNSSSFKDYDEIWFEDEDGEEVAGTRMTPTSTKPKVDFADDAFIVNISDTNGEILYLKANLATIGTGFNGTSDHYLGYKVDGAGDVVGKGALTGNASAEYLSSGSAPTGKTHYVYKAYPTFTKVNLTDNLTNGTNDLFKFTITAVGGDVALHGFEFDIVTTTCTVASLYLYDVTSASNETVLNDSAGDDTAMSSVFYATGVVWDTTGGDWTTNYSAQEVVVSPNQPRTFLVRGDVAGAASGDSISVRMSGDAAHVAGTDTLLHTAAEVFADANNDFIWSDNSAGAHTYGTDDWTNGYLMSGLPSTSSTSEVTSL